MKLKFTKMHGLGNDFVVIDTINQSVHLTGNNIRYIANRRTGVGCDQLLLVEAPGSDQVDFNYRIFNADGGEVEQCGNGARCFARFVTDNALINKELIRVSTNSGIIELKMENSGLVTVNMGAPQLEPDKIPFQATRQMNNYSLEIQGNQITLSAVSLGNPHAVIIVDDVDTAPVNTLGAILESDPHFPQRTNVGFMQILSDREIRLRVFERGVGETLACGTGACAAVVVGRLLKRLDESVEVSLPGGKLQIQWAGKNQPVYMTGPAITVYEGYMSL